MIIFATNIVTVSIDKNILCVQVYVFFDNFPDLFKSRIAHTKKSVKWKKHN
jgi:hypothetical protein